jgi:hypothetical protein
MKRLACLTLSTILLGGLAYAGHKEKHWHEDKHGRGRGGESCYFEQRDLPVLRSYYGPRYRQLPPGLEKKLYRQGRLPRGWEGRLQPFPVVVERQLPPLLPGYRRGWMDGYAVLYVPHTGVIIDVVAVLGR